MAHAVYAKDKVLECPWTVFSVTTKFCVQTFVTEPDWIRDGEGFAGH